MRLAIDAKWYFSGPPSGINVVKNIVDNFIKSDIKFDLFLIVQKDDLKNQSKFFKILKTKNIKLIPINSRYNFYFNLVLINKYLKKYKINIVLLQNFIPFFKLKNTIYVNYIHDYLFLDYPYYFTKID